MLLLLQHTIIKYEQHSSNITTTTFLILTRIILQCCCGEKEKIKNSNRRIFLFVVVWYILIHSFGALQHFNLYPTLENNSNNCNLNSFNSSLLQHSIVYNNIFHHFKMYAYSTSIHKRKVYCPPCNGFEWYFFLSHHYKTQSHSSEF